MRWPTLRPIHVRGLRIHADDAVLHLLFAHVPSQGSAGTRGLRGRRQVQGQQDSLHQGAHFFHNIIAARIGYLTVLPPDQVEGETRLHLAWLEGQRAVAETGRIRHIRLDAPLRIYLDGIAGRASILNSRPPQ